MDRDVQDFLDLLNTLDNYPFAPARELVAVLGDHTSGAAVKRVVSRYAKETGHQPYVFNGSSPGSLAFGHLRVSS
jgi:hypothetical protein